MTHRYDSEYYEKNKERIATQQKEYYLRHHEKILKRLKEKRLKKCHNCKITTIDNKI